MSGDTKSKTSWTVQPEWMQKLRSEFRLFTAHAFILHLNTGDTPVPTMQLPKYLDAALAAREMIVHYDRSRGVTFATEAMKELAIKIMDSTTNAASESPEMALMAGMLGGASTKATYRFPTEPYEALMAIETLLKTPYKMKDGQTRVVNAVLIVEYADTVFPNAPKAQMTPGAINALVTMLRFGTDTTFAGKPGQMIILITRNLTDLHSDLRTSSAKFLPIQIPLPSLTQRKEYIDWYLDQDAAVNKEDGVRLGEGVTRQGIAAQTAGLSFVNIRDIFLSASQGNILSASRLSDVKKEINRNEYGETLSTSDNPARYSDIGGVEHVKEIFRRRVVRPLREGDGKRAPMGVLMTGPAGTGKSLFAAATANEAGVNFVTLRIGGQIASMWQGEGERNLERALAAILSLAPTIVFVDEIDQAMRRGSGGGGSQQDNRIFQRLMEFMSDTSHRGQVVFLAATNRPDLLDAALKRPGRFDLKIPFLAPNPDERSAIFAVMARKYCATPDFKANDNLISATEGWTGAEIEAAAIKADQLRYDEVCDTVEQAMFEAVRRIKPTTANIEYMTMLAVAECNDTDLLPPKYREIDRAAVSERIQELAPSEPTLTRGGGRDL